MSKPRVLQIGPLPGAPGADEHLQSQYEVVALWRAEDKAKCLQEAQDIELIVTSALNGCKREVIESLPNLKAICSWGVGYETIDIEAAREHSVAVTITPDVLDDCVADEAWGLLIASARRIAEGDRFVRSNRWENKQGMLPLGVRVSGKRLGIVGLGRIGMAIAKRGKGFDMQIAYHNRRARTDVDYQYMASLTDLAHWSDFLIVATVGGAQTRGLVNREVLKALGPEGIIVNIARGPVIDETAMVELLVSGELGAAGLDVFEKEPKVPEALKTSDRTVLMPHVGSATVETRRAMFDLVLQNINAYFSGKPLITPVPTS